MFLNVCGNLPLFCTASAREDGLLRDLEIHVQRRQLQHSGSQVRDQFLGGGTGGGIFKANEKLSLLKF